MKFIFLGVVALVLFLWARKQIDQPGSGEPRDDE